MFWDLDTWDTLLRVANESLTMQRGVQPMPSVTIQTVVDGVSGMPMYKVGDRKFTLVADATWAARTALLDALKCLAHPLVSSNQVAAARLLEREKMGGR